MTYKAKIKMTDNELNYYNDLLRLDLEDESQQHDIERLSAKKDDYIGIRHIDFENGNFITIDLASGCSNYYDNICLFDKDGYELTCSDCTYEINSFSLFYENDIYDVEIEVV